MPNFPNGLLGAIQDPQFRQDVGRGLLDAGNRGAVAGLLGGPVDLATMAMRPFGYNVEKPVGGSEWIGQKMQNAGLVSDKRNALAEALAGVALPMAANPLAQALYRTETALAPKAAEMARGAIEGQMARSGMVQPIMAGMNAQTANPVALKAAQEMESRGVNPETIWGQTGWGKGPDGKWRFEVDDSGANFFRKSAKATDSEFSNFLDARKFLKETEKQKEAARQTEGFSVPKFYGERPGLYDQQQTSRKMVSDYESKYLKPQTKVGTADQFLEHDNLYRAYPDLANVSTHWDMQGSGGAYMPSIDSVRIGVGNEKSTMLHELQHAIQSRREGFAQGGNPALANMGDDAYMRLAGEAEARMTQHRMNMTPAQRAAQFPWAPSYFKEATGVPLTDLILR